MKKGFIAALVIVVSCSQASAQFFPKGKCTTVLGPAMFGKVDTARARGMADNYHTWDPGTVLLVKFLPGGSQQLREKVVQSAKEWEKYANVTFKFVADNAPFTHLRVKLGRGLGHNSAIGTEANFRAQNEATINFDTLFFADADYYANQLKSRNILPPYNLNQLVSEMQRDPNHWNNAETRRVMIHEFGHSLGLLHEQSYPDAINWKKTDSIYNYYWETQGWNRQQVDFNVFDVGSQFCTNGTKYDPKSIMHYAVNAWETTDGFSLKNNYEISAGDKALIAALYPKGNTAPARIVPKVTVSAVHELSVTFDDWRGGLVIKPTFDLKTNGKLGNVYFVARLTDERGNFIKTNSQYFNWGGNAAVYMKVNLLPNTRISYNKNGTNEVELFFPFKMFPELYGQRIRVAFAVYLDDVANNQLDKLMYFSATNVLNVPLKQF